MLAVVKTVVPAFSAHGYFLYSLEGQQRFIRFSIFVPSSSKLCLRLPGALKHIKVTKLNLSTDAADVAKLFII